jgi:Uri superfamily endonuclease
MPLTRNRLRTFDDDTAKKAPTEPGAYELLFKGTVVYIGSSETSIQSRIREHRKRKTFMHVTDFRYKKVEWADEARDLEAKLCRMFKKQNGGNRPRLQQRTPVNRSIFDWK